MKITSMGHLFAFLLFAAVVSNPAHAQVSGANSITVDQPWARATPGGAKTGAGYMTLINNGRSADALSGASTPVAGKVQFHEVVEENGISRMRELHTIGIQPGSKVIFAPGNMHIMLVGLKQPLREGQTFSLTLNFEKAGKVNVMVPVAKVGAMHHDDMGNMMPSAGETMKK